MTGEAVIEALMGLMGLLQLGLWLRMEHRMTHLEDTLEQYRRPDIKTLCPDCPMLVTR